MVSPLNTVEPPVVSVLLPVYNDERFIGAAVESILAQSFRALELIVIDDGSRDRTPEELARFSDPRLRVIRQENAGICVALNRAIAAARGQYFARMDSDDTCHPERIALQVAFLDARPDIGLVGSACLVVDEEGHLLREFDVPLTDEQIRQEMARHNPIVHSAVMMRREILAQVGGYDEELARFAHDYQLWWRMTEVTRLANLPEPLVTRVHRVQGPFRITKSRHYSASLRLQGWVVRQGHATLGQMLPAMVDSALRWAAHRLLEETAGRVVRLAMRRQQPARTSA